ncbi:MAG: DUF1653 domain-containing protein [Clostridia bacterium]|nr:DUF1653 domain-containing protein [Clostridia bacterium]MBQ9793289.1 DUF1653 domain-containing protein [Clostridia bacterium]
MAEVGKYKHFKGAEIQVLGFAKDSETLKNMVIYKHLDTNEIWVRSEEMFDETIERNNKKIKRFEKIN